MADKIAFNVDLGELANFTPTEGLGGNALLKQDGFYKGHITKIVLKKSSTGNPMWLVQQIVDDEDEKGQSLLQNVLLGGKDKNGEPLSRQLGAFMTGVGLTQDQIRAFAQKGSVDGEQLAQLFIGKPVHFSAEAETYEGKMSTKINNYVSEQQYKDAVAANAHRKPRRADASFSGTPAGVVSGPTNVGGAGALGNIAPANGAGKADPMKALAGLNLPI